MKNLRSDIQRSLDHLRRMNPAGYAQLSLASFSTPPAYVEDDPRHPWWSSDEALQFLQGIKDAAREGVKPGPVSREIHWGDDPTPQKVADYYLDD